MYKVSAKIIGTSPLVFGGVITSVKENETDADFERRVWRERAHRDQDGNLVISGYAIKSMMVAISGYLREKIRGLGNSTYKSKFSSGVRCPQDVVRLEDLSGKPIPVDTVPGMWKFVPSDGRKGGGSRVMKCFPYVNEWSANIQILVLDEIIKPDKITTYLSAAGIFNGLGTWRPGSSGGDYGTFMVDDDSVSVDEITF